MNHLFNAPDKERSGEFNIQFIFKYAIPLIQYFKDLTDKENVRIHYLLNELHKSYEKTATTLIQEVFNKEVNMKSRSK